MAAITVGVLGAARGLTLAGLFDAHPHTTVVAIADSFPTRLSLATEQLPNARAYHDYEQMLSGSNRPDVVVVASSPADHVRHSCMALEAGCAVLSEVPAAETLEDAQSLVDTVARTGGFYMLGENCNWYGYIRAWKQMLQDGELGDVVHAEGEYIHDLRHVTWSDAGGNRISPDDADTTPGAVRHWRGNYEPIRYLTHSLGPLLWLMETRCTHVSCIGAPPRAHHTIGSPDLQVALFRTESDAPIRQTVGFSVPHEPGGQWFGIYGTKAHVEGSRAGWDRPKIYRDGQESNDMTATDSTVSPELTYLGGKGGHGGIDAGLVEAFVGAFAADEPPPIDIHTGLDYTLAGIYAALSAQQGGVQLRIPDTRNERLV
jgi:predicted dehydrogenase